MGAETDAVAWVRALGLDDIWEGELVPVTVEGEELILVHLEGGHVSAFLSACPHQGSTLEHAIFDGGTLVCPAHRWEFDARSGAGINPARACLTTRRVRIHDDAVWLARTPREGDADGR